MCTPKTFIGCYPIVKCEQYGFVGEIPLGGIVYLHLNDDNNIIVSCNYQWIGELQVSESERKIFIPLIYVNGNANGFFFCKIAQVDNKENCNNRYKVSIWAKKVK